MGYLHVYTYWFYSYAYIKTLWCQKTIEILTIIISWNKVSCRTRFILRMSQLWESRSFWIRYYIEKQWSPRVGGGPPTRSVIKKFFQIRFDKSCRTLTTIQPREKSELTKVVLPLKRFGRYSNTLVENRIFVLKISLSPTSPLYTAWKEEL